jgi:hypothetical protein
MRNACLALLSKDPWVITTVPITYLLLGSKLTEVLNVAFCIVTHLFGSAEYFVAAVILEAEPSLLADQILACRHSRPCW